MPRFYTPKEVAEILRVSTEQVRCWIRSRQLEGVCVGTGKKKIYRVSEEALEKFLKQGGLDDGYNLIFR